eukprot:COSAG01_NODE_1200_length_11277_cov_59.330739_10_plen_36_part_00
MAAVSFVSSRRFPAGRQRVANGRKGVGRGVAETGH